VHRQDIEATDYRIDATWKVFARMENVTNTRYQEGPQFRHDRTRCPRETQCHMVMREESD
jgi:hypothetical protein